MVRAKVKARDKRGQIQRGLLLAGLCGCGGPFCDILQAHLVLLSWLQLESWSTILSTSWSDSAASSPPSPTASTRMETDYEVFGV